MISRFLPKEEGFFELFNESAALTLEAAKNFKNLLNSGANAANIARSIKTAENKADEITHKTMLMLHRTFITPLDREDIHELIKRLDDILDFLDASAQRYVLYELDHAPPEMVQLAEITIASCELVKKCIGGLSNLKNAQDLFETCVQINKLENDADHVLRSAVAGLFKNESDLRRLIKLKEIYELLETVTDRCEDVANLIEGIVLENS